MILFFLSFLSYSLYFTLVCQGIMQIMRLERLTLKNFRNYSKKTITFGQTNLFIAPNGSGKSNLLEAIDLLATGLSRRASKIEEMIQWDCEVGSVVGVVRGSDESYTELTVVLTRGMVAGKRSPKRRYLIDGVGRSRVAFVGRLIVSMFEPADMRLIEGSRSRRRDYLDSVLSQAHPEYVRALVTYNASLVRRNRILDMIREGRSKRAELAYWDASLIKNGNIVTDYRREYLRYLSEEVKVNFGEYKLDYLSSVISPARLAQYEEAEVAVGYTLVGPHKDDFVILNTKSQTPNPKQETNLMIYGSRGEQRLGVLFLKIGAMEYLEEKIGVKALLLLDDIFSELDEGHRSEVTKLMEGRQVVVTSAEEKTSVNLMIREISIDRLEAP